MRTRSIVSHNHNFLWYRGTVKVADMLLVLSLFYCFPLSAEPSINVSFYSFDSTQLPLASDIENLILISTFSLCLSFFSSLHGQPLSLIIAYMNPH